MNRTNWVVVALASCLAMSFFSGCDSSPGGSSGSSFLSTILGSDSPSQGGGAGNTPAPPSAQEVAATEIASLNQELNSTDQYALTEEDVALLQSQNLLQAGETENLNQLVKH